MIRLGLQENEAGNEIVGHHAEPTGLPHVSIEVRQDLVSTPEGADRWSAILGGVLREILADEQLYSILDSASG